MRRWEELLYADVLSLKQNATFVGISSRFALFWWRNKCCFESWSLFACTFTVNCLWVIIICFQLLTKMLLTVKRSKYIEVRSCFKVFAEVNAMVQSDLNLVAQLQNYAFFQLETCFFGRNLVWAHCTPWSDVCLQKKSANSRFCQKRQEANSGRFHFQKIERP